MKRWLLLIWKLLTKKRGPDITRAREDALVSVCGFGILNHIPRYIQDKESSRLDCLHTSHPQNNSQDNQSYHPTPGAGADRQTKDQLVPNISTLPAQ
jgi:hypothetical protein